ncbi:hypothetical protein C8Q72DRAFT_370282 [Fomitopsis betulina]|nr:hypothetical protein C8Q72DRAFT_370282 [Fomitopsis betulina]
MSCVYVDGSTCTYLTSNDFDPVVFCGPWRVIAHYFRSHAASPCLRVLRSLATEAGELMVTPCHIEKSDIETCHCHVSSPTVFKILGLALSVVNGEHCHRLKTPGIAKAPTAGGLTHGTLLFFPRLNWIPPPPPPRLFINRIFAIYPFSPEGVHGADTCHCSRLAQTTKSDKQILAPRDPIWVLSFIHFLSSDIASTQQVGLWALHHENVRGLTDCYVYQSLQL